MARKYSVWHKRHQKDDFGLAPHLRGKIYMYFVCDWEAGEENVPRSQLRPVVAEFPITHLHDEETQGKRAYEMCKVLNGFVRYEITEAGKEDDERLAKEKAERAALDALRDEQRKIDQAKKQAAKLAEEEERKKNPPPPQLPTTEDPIRSWWKMW